MKSRDEIVIIMLQCMCLYTLGSRGSRELKKFHEIRLICSRINQKLKNNREIHQFLKGKLAQRSWAIDTVVGADLMRRGSGLHWAASWLQSRAELALIPLQLEPRSSHDRGTIATRSGHDRDFGAPEMVVRISGKDHS